jgi:hypothetical protein
MDKFRGYGDNIELQSADKLITHKADRRRFAIRRGRAKGPERTLANNWSFSEESPNRPEEISRNYILSPEDQVRSDELIRA